MLKRQAGVLPLNFDAMSRVHPACACATFWELDPLSDDTPNISPDIDKEAWLTAQIFAYGSCGFNIVDRGSSTASAYATVLFCTRDEAPGSLRMPTAPASTDAWLISSLHIDPEFAGRGWEAVLLDSCIMTLTDRGVPAVEAFARHDEPADPADDFVASMVERAEEIGLMNRSTLEGAGFSIVKDDPVLPRLRLELPPQRGLLSSHEIEQLLHYASVPR